MSEKKIKDLENGRELVEFGGGFPMIRYKTPKGIYYRGLDNHEWLDWYGKKIANKFGVKVD